MDLATERGSAYWVIVVIALIIGVLWICLPFAVFGIKRRLDKQATLLRAILEELQEANGRAVGRIEPHEDDTPPARRGLLIQPRADRPPSEPTTAAREPGPPN